MISKNNKSELAKASALTEEFHKKGINLNQIAHHLNSGYDFTEPIANDLISRADDLRKLTNYWRSDIAILKHLSSKSANYGRAVEYLMYEQDRLTNRSIEDENGRLIMRENFIIDSLDCNVSTFDAECRMLNNRYHKNQKYGDIKSHHYIISFDPKDAIEGKLTMKDAQQIGMEYASARSRSEKEFAHILKARYNITFKISRGRYSYILPNREKAIRGKALGTNYTEEFLRVPFNENTRNRARTNANNRTNEPSRNRANEPTKNRFPIEHSTPSREISNLETLDSVKRRNVKYPTAFTMDTRLPFVRDLQISAITTTNRAIDRGIKITNLKEMAETIIFMEEHGISSREALDNAYQNTRDKLYYARSALKNSENSIDALNEQIHYTGQYLVNKDVYNAYLKARNKDRFRFEHRKEIVLYEAAMRYLKEHIEEGTLPSRAHIKTTPGKFPTLSTLKSTRDKLIKKQQPIRARYKSAKNEEKRLYTIKRNVDNMLQEPSLEHQRKRTIDIER